MIRNEETLIFLFDKFNETSKKRVKSYSSHVLSRRSAMWAECYHDHLI